MQGQDSHHMKTERIKVSKMTLSICFLETCKSKAFWNIQRLNQKKKAQTGNFSLARPEEGIVGIPVIRKSQSPFQIGFFFPDSKEERKTMASASI